MVATSFSLLTEELERKLNDIYVCPTVPPSAAPPTRRKISTIRKERSTHLERKTHYWSAKAAQTAVIQERKQRFPSLESAFEVLADRSYLRIIINPYETVQPVPCTVVGYGRNAVYLEPISHLGLFEKSGRFLKLDQNSKPIDGKHLNLVDFPLTYQVDVYSLNTRQWIEAVHCGEKRSFEVSWTVDLYHFVDEMPLGRNQIVAVSSKNDIFAVIHGTSFKAAWPIPIEDDGSIVPQSLLIGEVYKIKHAVEQVHVRIGDHPAVFYLEYSSNLHPPEGFVLPPIQMESLRKVRPLGKKELRIIRTMCREFTTLSLEEAKLYIRDPMVAVSMLKHYVGQQGIKDTTVTVRVPVDHTTSRIRIALSSEQSSLCLDHKSIRCWRIGTELCLHHPKLCPSASLRNGVYLESEAHKVLEMSKLPILHVSDIQRRAHISATVTFILSEDARQRFEILERAQKRLQGHICIGPRNEMIDNRAQILIDTFERLFDNDCPRFRYIRGANNGDEIVFSQPPVSNRPIQVGGISLDRSQNLAIRVALSHDYITTISAPAGSGKTLMIAGIVAKSSEKEKKMASTVVPYRVVIAATTNPAATGTIQMARRALPEVKTCRLFSHRAEEEFGESGTADSISLKRMAKNAQRYIDLTIHVDVAAIMAQLQVSRDCLGRTTTIDEGLHYLLRTRKLEQQLMLAFAEAYQPTVLGSTVDLMAHAPEFAVGINHLILDEAAQMDSISAFALYATLPNINQITLVGDTNQLQPFNELEETSQAYQLYKCGELTRLEKITRNTTHTSLNTIYRSHPKLTEMLLKPVYGTGITAGTTAEQRDLTVTYGLPTAEDGTPCLFVQVEGKNDNDGVNKKEIEACWTILKKIERKLDEQEATVTLADVAIVCHHRAQKGKLIEKLNGTGDIGPHKLPCIVTTVDSFQGKEAKVVIVMTTKYCSSRSFDSINSTLRFISDPHRGTVAISRSTDLVYLLGDWSKTMYTPFWKKFINNIVASQALVSEDLSRINATHFFRNHPRNRD